MEEEKKIEEVIDLDEKLVEALGENIEDAIEKVANQKDWASFEPELLTILTSITTQVATNMGMKEEDFHDFISQFFNSDSEKNVGMEMYSINTRIKNNGKPN